MANNPKKHLRLNYRGANPHVEGGEGRKVKLGEQKTKLQNANTKSYMEKRQITA